MTGDVVAVTDKFIQLINIYFIICTIFLKAAATYTVTDGIRLICAAGVTKQSLLHSRFDIWHAIHTALKMPAEWRLI